MEFIATAVTGGRFTAGPRSSVAGSGKVWLRTERAELLNGGARTDLSSLLNAPDLCFDFVSTPNTPSAFAYLVVVRWR